MPTLAIDVPAGYKYHRLGLTNISDLVQIVLVEVSFPGHHFLHF